MSRKLISAGVGLALTLLAGTASAADVSLTTGDGVKLHAQHYGGGEKGVILLHSRNRSSTDWSYIGEKLSGSFNVLAVDLRGHGKSAIEAELTEEVFQLMVGDVGAAAEWLRQNGAKEVSLVGAELGANLAINYAASDAAVVNLVLLSPGLNHQGFKISGPLATYGERPVLFVASENDPKSSKACTLLGERAAGDSHVELLPDAGSGVKMFNRAPSLEGTMVAWLNQTFRMSRGEGSNAEANLQTGEVGDIETTGVLLEDRGKEKEPEAEKLEY
ncbi:MAG: alpha/beta hydrolase [Proteobacteria bacterium]|jgi:alpha-beta hydrolase superfamily lysophospholipase|nr:alpha/beta hydrolase [Pseudomonadota bacterium]